MAESMYPAKSGSPTALLTAPISDTDDSATFDTDVLPSAPNIATLGVGATAEVVIFTGNTGTTISGMTRGASGTAAQAWPIGTPISRRYTSHDHDAFRLNITNLNGTAASTFQLDNDDTGAQIKNVAGEMQVRNAADDGYADLRAGSYYGDGSNLTDVGAASATALTLSATNKTGASLPKGVVVYISGASGSKSTIAKASCTDAAKIRVMGITAEVIADNATGLIRVKGELLNVDTFGATDANPNDETWAAGDLLWLHDSNGGMTNVRPTSGRSIKCAYSLKGSDNNDTLLVIVRENEVWNTCAAGEDVVLRLGDAIGVNKVSIRDYADNEVASINSDGYILGIAPMVKTSAYTALAGDTILADTDTTAAFTVTLPAAATAGDIITIYDAKGTFATANLTVARNGLNIRGAAADLALDVNWSAIKLVYIDATTGWIYI